MKKLLLLATALISMSSLKAQTAFDVIQNSPDHNTLEAAVLAAGLDGALGTLDPITVFAPTDAAFDALPAGTVEALLNDIPALTNILLYHVLNGAAVFSTDLTDGQVATMANDADIVVTLNGGVFINGTNQVTAADVVVSNGVLHVINGVLLPPAVEQNTAWDIIENSPDHTILEAAVIAAGLDGALGTLDPITVFAPTDAAFGALPAGTVDALLADIPALTNILLYHVLNGAAVLSTQLSDGQVATMANDADIVVTINDINGGVFINGTNQVTAADIVVSNGVLHVIDGVLLPSSPELQNSIWDVIVASPDHNTLEAVVGLAGLDGALDAEGSYTVFAPTDAAFALVPQPIIDALLADPSGLLTYILTYHVVTSEALSTDLSDGMTITTLSGENVTVTIANGSVFINQAQVTVADIITDNGIVHVIDAVLAPGVIANNVFDIIAGSPDHTILETAIIAAGLQETLEDQFFFTVFAPTDAAFGALPAGTIESLLANPAALTDILLYHVVGDAVASEDLSNGQSVTMLQDDATTITLDMNGAMINNANIVAADLNAFNGFVHVIDAVLLPPTSIEGLNSMAVTAFPNPCRDNITIEGNNNTLDMYNVYNAAGQVVAQGKLNGKFTVVSTDFLSNGLYTLMTEKGFRVNFIKE
jgi:uncharacterized surface protein with fasciclin (FAS1) repeats